MYQHAAPLLPEDALALGDQVFVVDILTDICPIKGSFISPNFPRRVFVKAGTTAIRAAIRSAQCEYWNRGADLWLKTGDLVKDQRYAMSLFLFKA